MIKTISYLVPQRTPMYIVKHFKFQHRSAIRSFNGYGMKQSIHQFSITIRNGSLICNDVWIRHRYCLSVGTVLNYTVVSTDSILGCVGKRSFTCHQFICNNSKRPIITRSLKVNLRIIKLFTERIFFTYYIYYLHHDIFF